jgi:hypothetical protein
VESPLSWIEAIKRLDDPKEYKAASERCIERAKQVQKETPKELDEMEHFFMNIINRKI